MDADATSPHVEELLRHAAFARRVARALVVDWASADDVVQEAWVAALKARPRPGLGLRAWFGTVVQSVARQRRRGEERRLARELASAHSEVAPSTADLAAERSVQRALLDAVERLEEPYRSTVHLRYLRELPVAEIARVEGAPVKTVETRLRRALEKLRGELADGRDDARAWLAALVPLAAFDPTVGGGIVVGAKAKAAMAAGFVAAAAIGVTLVVRGGDQVQESPVADAASVPAVTAPVEATPEVARTEEAGRAASAAPAATTVVRVISPFDRPLVNARLAVWRELELLGKARTDERGEARLPQVDTAARLGVKTGEAPLHIESFPANANDHEVRLPAGSVFTGHVLVDGKPPLKPLSLGLIIARKWIGPDEEPPSTTFEFLGARAKDNSYRTKTDVGGAFAFFGFDPDSELWLSPPPGLEGDEMRFPMPRTNVLIAWASSPAWRGRLVTSTGQPVPGWSVRVALTGTLAQDAGWGKSGDDGTFWFPVSTGQGGSSSQIGDVRAAFFTLEEENGPGRGWVELEGNFPLAHDLGDLVLPPQRALTIELVDDQGAPIEEARLRLAPLPTGDPAMDDPEWRVVEIPAARARAGVVVAAESRRLSVLAPGYAPFSTTLSEGEAPLSLKIPLASSTELTVEAADAEGRPLHDLRLEIDAEEWPLTFDAPEWWRLQNTFAPNQRVHRSLRDDGGWRLSMTLGDDGRATVYGLATGLGLELVARDEAGVEVKRDGVVLRPKERRTVSWTLDLARNVRGRLVDEENRPIREARIRLVALDFDDTDPASRSREAEVDDPGLFRFEGVLATRATLIVDQSAFAYERRTIELPKDGTEIVLKLRQTRTLGFETFSDSPLTLLEGDAWIELPSPQAPTASDLKPADGGVGRLVSREQGRFRFDDLPPGKLVAKCRVDDVTYAMIVDGHSSAYAWELDQHGAAIVEVALSPPAANEPDRMLREVRLVPEGKGIAKSKPFEHFQPPPITRTIDFGAVRAGHYRVELVFWDLAEQRLVTEPTDATLDVAYQKPARVRIER